MSYDLQTCDVLTSVSTDPVENLMVALCEQAQAAHTAANLEHTPFHVQLPSRDNPFFAVQNFGKGYTREELLALYGAESAHDNEICEIQAKACYDYCSNFFVATVEQGKKVEASFWYDLFDDKPDALMLGPMDKTPKDPQGMRVSLQTRLTDVDHFLAVALDVLPNYNVTISYDEQPFILPPLANESRPVAVTAQVPSFS